MRTREEEPRNTRNTRNEGRSGASAEAEAIGPSRGASVRAFRVFRVFRGSLIGGSAALAVAGGAQAQSRVSELLNEPVAIAPGFEAHMIIVDVPPAGNGPLTTAGQAGHRHPASTYAYVSKGAVISRLGDGAEKRFETGQSWSETPNQPHYMVNASKTEPAQLVVVQIAKAGTKTLTEPLPK